ncbi:hypothetical protein OA846_02605, partial [Paracoccaceae bacterium]|nr:hypothetical protein [Paracoccaceae bacterium]
MGTPVLGPAPLCLPSVPRSTLRQILSSCASGIFIVYTIVENRTYTNVCKIAVKLVALGRKECWLSRQ